MVNTGAADGCFIGTLVGMKEGIVDGNSDIAICCIEGRADGIADGVADFTTGGEVLGDVDKEILGLEDGAVVEFSATTLPRLLSFDSICLLS